MKIKTILFALVLLILLSFTMISKPEIPSITPTTPNIEPMGGLVLVDQNQWD